MSVYVYDLDPLDRKYPPRREWAKLVAPWVPMDWTPETDASERGDVVICHSSWLNDDVREAAARAAARGVVVLVVSGARLSGKLDRGIYHRHAFVAKPVDPAFTAAFQRFATYLKANGRPRWDLIEPFVAPEILLAYYLCLLADMEELVTRAVGGPTLREAARTQCDQLLKRLADATLPPVGCELSQANIRRILGAI